MKEFRKEFRKEGKQKGSVDLLVRLFEKKFKKALTIDIKAEIIKFDLKQIEKISENFFEIKDSNELKKVLHKF